MSDAFTDVAKMKKIKEEIKAHEGQKNKFGRLIEVYPSLFIIEYTNENSLPGEPATTYVESYTYSDILTEKNLIHYLD